jgi:hypothetical protein
MKPSQPQSRDAIRDLANLFSRVFRRLLRSVHYAVPATSATAIAQAAVFIVMVKGPLFAPQLP